ncbi:MAG: hypothetical protein JSR93_10150 [Verrucomicrobia bacterium]|nr:hypothetical protein [Verrucomicrobiota bacterium]
MQREPVQWQFMAVSPKRILCGSDQAQEWLLPWWWSRLRDHNDHPIAFCDFGMSEDALNWCRERGEVIPILSSPVDVASKEAFSSDFVDYWEKNYTAEVWSLRKVCFKKPFAFLRTPFQRTLWLDIDCEVLGKIDPLFNLWNAESQIAIMRDFISLHLPVHHPESIYNGGVIVFEHGTPLIQQWASSAMQMTNQFGSDDILLSHLINSMRIPVIEIPDIYNWRISEGINLDAVIWHWMRDGGKTFIQKFGGFKPALDQFRSAK